MSEVVYDLWFTQLPEAPKPIDTDFDLDSLLSDLTSFDPSSVVAASHPQPTFPATPPQLSTPVRSESSSAQSTPQHGARAQHTSFEPSPTPPGTPGAATTPIRSHTQVDRNYQPRREPEAGDIPRSYTEAKFSPDHKRPAGVLEGCMWLTMVKQNTCGYVVCADNVCKAFRVSVVSH